MLRRRPVVRYTGPPIDRFDTVVLIAPIWAHQLAGPMRSFVAMHRAQLPAVAVVSVMESRGAPRAVAEIGQLIGRSPVLGTAFTTREVDDGSFATRLQAFGDAVLHSRASPPVRPSIWSPQAV